MDTTHGGIVLSEVLSKYKLKSKKLDKIDNIWVLDVYNNLDNIKEKDLIKKGIKILELDRLKDFISKKENLIISSPIHCPLNHNNQFSENNFNNLLKNKEIELISHHDLVSLILNEWKLDQESKKQYVVEVTGVKGKTTIVSMLKHLFIDSNPLELSSLGAKINYFNEEYLLKRDISITPASIVEIIKIFEDLKKYGKINKEIDYNISIFECSLGGTGLADVGIISNIAENYLISKNSSNSAIAKFQMFKSKITCVEYETLEKYYPRMYYNYINNKLECTVHDYCKNPVKNIKVNTFSVKSSKANLFTKKIEYGSLKTNIHIKFNDIQTLNNESISGSLNIKTYAPGVYHVSNVLATVCAALTLGQSIELIENKFKSYKPLQGRSSIQSKNKTKIYEEINPGINLKAIEKGLEMIKSFEKAKVVIGGKYGITCEEISEKLTANLLDEFINQNKIDVFLSDELGKNIGELMKNKVKYHENINECINEAIDNGAENILLIYRSNYSQLQER